MDILIIMRDNLENDDIIIDKILGRFTGKEDTANNDNVIDSDTLKKYLHYAKEKFNPILSEDALNIAIEYSKDIRKKLNSFDSHKLIRFDTRDVNSLARIGGAIAKLHLRNIILAEDIEKAKEIKNFCLSCMGYDYYVNEFVEDTINGLTTPAKMENRQTVLDIINERKSDYKAKGILSEFIGVEKQYIKDSFEEITNKSSRTCDNAIKELYEKNIIKKNPKGRQVYYDISE